MRDSRGGGRASFRERALPCGARARHLSRAMETIAHPPATLEGWYALHQILTVERVELRALAPGERTAALGEARAALEELAESAQGWSAVVPLVGSRAEVMLVHFRATLDELREVQQRLARLVL